jgi:hypothetical protein
MNRLNNPAYGWTIKSVPFVRPGFGGTIRLIVGIGINAIGAGVLLADSVHFFGLPL